MAENLNSNVDQISCCSNQVLPKVLQNRSNVIKNVIINY